MMEVACTCNWGIPGVETLPPHDHNQERLVADLLRLNSARPDIEELVAAHYPLRDGVHIWVDWRRVARVLMKSPAVTPPASPTWLGFEEEGLSTPAVSPN